MKNKIILAVICALAIALFWLGRWSKKPEVIEHEIIKPEVQYVEIVKEGKPKIITKKEVIEKSPDCKKCFEQYDPQCPEVERIIIKPEPRISRNNFQLFGGAGLD